MDEEIIEKILKFKPQGKVLDLGCGEGEISIELAKKGFDVTCIDISEDKIEEINELPKIKAVCSDLKDYVIDENYDVILVLGVLHFLSKEKVYEIMDNIKEKTKQEGLNIYDVLAKGDVREEENLEGHYFTIDELKEIYDGWEIFELEEFMDLDEEDGVENKVIRLIFKKI